MYTTRYYCIFAKKSIHVAGHLRQKPKPEINLDRITKCFRPGKKSPWYDFAIKPQIGVFSKQDATITYTAVMALFLWIKHRNLVIKRAYNYNS